MATDLQLPNSPMMPGAAVIAGAATCSPMTAKDYCSKVCGAKCCRAHDPIISPSKCPMLTADNLCSIYERRLGFKFDGLRKDGTLITCVCTKPKRFLKTLAPDVLAQCCIAHPELLENAVALPE